MLSHSRSPHHELLTRHFLTFHFHAFHFYAPLQRAFLPLLQITHQTEPLTAVPRLEHLLVVGRQVRLQQEDLDECAVLRHTLPEVHTGLNHPCIVKYHQGSLRQVAAQVTEHVLTHLAPFVDQQLRLVALRQRIFRYALVGQLIVIVADCNLSCIHHFILGLQSYCFLRKPPKPRHTSLRRSVKKT